MEVGWALGILILKYAHRSNARSLKGRESGLFEVTRCHFVLPGGFDFVGSPFHIEPRFLVMIRLGSRQCREAEGGGVGDGGFEEISSVHGAMRG